MLEPFTTILTEDYSLQMSNLGFFFHFCSSWRSFFENRCFSSKMRGNALVCVGTTAELLLSYSIWVMVEIRLLATARTEKTHIIT